MDAVRVTRSGRRYKTPRASKSQCSVKSPEQNCRKRLDKIWDSTTKFDDLIIEEIKKQLSPKKAVKCIFTPTSPLKTPKKTSSVLPSLASPLRCLSLNSPKGAGRETRPLPSPKKSVCLSSIENVCTTPKKSHHVISPSKVQKSSPKRYINYPLATSPSKKRREETSITVTPIKSRGFYSPTKMNPIRSPLKEVQRPSLNSMPINSPQGKHADYKSQSILKSKSLFAKSISADSPNCSDKAGVIPPNNTPNVPLSNQVPQLTPSCNQDQKQVYNKVIHALHNSSPNQLIGRDDEIKNVKDFLLGQINTNTAASLYISGAPGTGKTACVTNILSDKSLTNRLKHVITVNCMAMTSATSIYQRIAFDMGIKKSKVKTAKAALKHIEKKLTEDGPMILMFLDEMDQLDNTNQEVLYTIFGWTSLTNSRLVLIGIANSLDLTDRILPRLQSNLTCKPTVKHFKPYTKEQLARILNARISNVASGSAVIDSSAIQFCARKVAAMTGDARKALDICRRSVEVHNTPIKSSPATVETPKSTKVGVRQVSSVISEVYQSAILTKPRDDENDDDSFPLQQKLLVCSLVLLNKRSKSKEGLFGKLYETYGEVCKNRHVSSVGQSEFYSLCELIEARGILSVKKSKQLRQTKIKLNVDEKDVEYALKGKAMLSSILQSA